MSNKRFRLPFRNEEEFNLIYGIAHGLGYIALGQYVPRYSLYVFDLRTKQTFLEEKDLSLENYSELSNYNLGYIMDSLSRPHLELGGYEVHILKDKVKIGCSTFQDEEINYLDYILYDPEVPDRLSIGGTVSARRAMCEIAFSRGWNFYDSPSGLPLKSYDEFNKVYSGLNNLVFRRGVKAISANRSPVDEQFDLDAFYSFIDQGTKTFRGEPVSVTDGVATVMGRTFQMDEVDTFMKAWRDAGRWKLVAEDPKVDYEETIPF